MLRGLLTDSVDNFVDESLKEEASVDFPPFQTDCTKINLKKITLKYQHVI